MYLTGEHFGIINRDEMRSPGCFPMIISNANTPKLYTSHFSLISIVYASSVIEKKIEVPVT